MFTRKVLASLAAAGLVLGSTAAAAAPARTASPVGEAEGASAWPAFLGVGVLAILVIVVASNSEIDESPRSP